MPLEYFGMDENSDTIIPVQNSNYRNTNRHDIYAGNADSLLNELFGKLPKFASKPIVIQHKRTIDEKFSLFIDENPSDKIHHGIISTISAPFEQSTDEGNSNDLISREIKQSNGYNDSRSREIDDDNDSNDTNNDYDDDSDNGSDGNAQNGSG